jgi:hypothetical protein
MSLPLNHPQKSLPRRFPIGARFVVEGYGGDQGALRVIARYVVLPGGRRINVPAELPLPAARLRPFRRIAAAKQPAAKGRSLAGKKVVERRGTALALER